MRKIEPTTSAIIQMVDRSLWLKWYNEERANKSSLNWVHYSKSSLHEHDHTPCYYERKIQASNHLLYRPHYPSPNQKVKLRRILMGNTNIDENFINEFLRKINVGTEENQSNGDWSKTFAQSCTVSIHGNVLSLWIPRAPTSVFHLTFPRHVTCRR